jgi:hypothetical protein
MFGGAGGTPTPARFLFAIPSSKIFLRSLTLPTPFFRLKDSGFLQVSNYG